MSWTGAVWAFVFAAAVVEAQTSFNPYSVMLSDEPVTQSPSPDTEKNLNGIQRLLGDNRADLEDFLQRLAEDAGSKALEAVYPPYKYAEVAADLSRADDAWRNGRYAEAISHTGEAVADISEAVGAAKTAAVDLPAYVFEGSNLLRQRLQLLRAYVSAKAAIDSLRAKRSNRGDFTDQSPQNTLLILPPLLVNPTGDQPQSAPPNSANVLLPLSGSTSQTAPDGPPPGSTNSTPQQVIGDQAPDTDQPPQQLAGTAASNGWCNGDFALCEEWHDGGDRAAFGDPANTDPVATGLAAAARQQFYDQNPQLVPFQSTASYMSPATDVDAAIQNGSLGGDAGNTGQQGIFAAAKGDSGSPLAATQAAINTLTANPPGLANAVGGLLAGTDQPQIQYLQAPVTPLNVINDVTLAGSPTTYYNGLDASGNYVNFNPQNGVTAALGASPGRQDTNNLTRLSPGIAQIASVATTKPALPGSKSVGAPSNPLGQSSGSSANSTTCSGGICCTLPQVPNPQAVACLASGVQNYCDHTWVIPGSAQVPPGAPGGLQLGPYISFCILKPNQSLSQAKGSSGPTPNKSGTTANNSSPASGSRAAAAGPSSSSTRAKSPATRPTATPLMTGAARAASPRTAATRTGGIDFSASQKYIQTQNAAQAASARTAKSSKGSQGQGSAQPSAAPRSTLPKSATSAGTNSIEPSPGVTAQIGKSGSMKEAPHVPALTTSSQESDHPFNRQLADATQRRIGVQPPLKSPQGAKPLAAYGPPGTISSKADHLRSAVNPTSTAPAHASKPVHTTDPTPQPPMASLHIEPVYPHIEAIKPPPPPVYMPLPHMEPINPMTSYAPLHIEPTYPLIEAIKPPLMTPFAPLHIEPIKPVPPTTHSEPAYTSAPGFAGPGQMHSVVAPHTPPPVHHR